ncbi:MAG TPA: rhomboid family intramembrane serine protease [Frankiaceae bacterium]|nr:rhomboid family intramembrane serine protease [Frankiaceae bacterium]
MVLPVHDRNPLRRTPVVTWTLIAVNVAVFVLATPLLTSVGGMSTPTPAALCQQERFFDHYGAIPKELLDNRQLPQAPTGAVAAVDPERGTVACATNRPTQRPPFEKSPALSVLTAMFLHGGWLHLLGNMLFLLVFGNNVEDRMGRLPFLVFYLVCGYAAAYGYSALTGPSTTTLIGASGAIAGVLGAYLVTFPRARVLSLLTFLFFLPVWLPAWVVLGSWFLLQYAYFSGVGVAAGGDVAYGAHVVGFVVGALIALPFVRRLRAPAHHRL